ncbi:MAG: DUF262 domain-containing protein [Bacteroidetes bacterium]|nr:DUF262 domain-containing protein [Bacteroidota bacterium]
MSVQARDRKIEVWYNKIRFGEIKLPRFQRHEAWDKGRISSLLTMIMHDLPLGITLVLEVDQEKFISRYMVTAEFKEPPYPKVNEHLLDGQQRLTAIWRALHNNYELEKYFLYVRDYDTIWYTDSPMAEEEEQGQAIKTKVLCQNRWIGKRRKRLMPLWADDPQECFNRGCIPMELFRPIDISPEIEAWVKTALESKRPQAGNPDFEKAYENYTEEKQNLLNLINKYRETIKHYNLPFLALPSSTSKDTALEVFINMNTNSKPLTQYDIIVAEIEGLKDTSLHQLQEKLNASHPAVGRYFDLSYLILNTSALMQEKVPNRVGIWDMDKKLLVDQWDSMVKGLSKMAGFLENHKLFDEERLPTNAVLAVIAALYTRIPETGDQAGQANVLLKKYLWSSFFTERYENSAASRAYADYMALLNIIKGNKKATGQPFQEMDVPVLNRSFFPLSSEEQLLNVTWPKRVSIRGRGILAVANYFGAGDFADGSIINAINVSKREYHHIFPDALIQEANEFYAEDEINSTIALNCALITGNTNRSIGRKEPLTYLKERYEWVSEAIVSQRLNSHLIPLERLKAGDYEGLSDEAKANKIKADFENFIASRAALIVRAVAKLANGEEVTALEILN